MSHPDSSQNSGDSEKKLSDSSEELTVSPKTPEEMAEQLGIPVEQLASHLQKQIEEYKRLAENLANAMKTPTPQKFNRAERRALKKRGHPYDTR